MTKDQPPKEPTAGERKVLDEARAARFALARKLFDEVRAFQPPDPYHRAPLTPPESIPAPLAPTADPEAVP